MDYFMEKAKVYIQTNARGLVVRCEGGYSLSNIRDISDWILIDEGEGSSYTRCQAEYFDGGLYTFDHIPRWVYEDGAVRERSEDEIEADRAALKAEQGRRERERVANATETVLLEMAAEHEERLCLLEMGVTEDDL